MIDVYDLSKALPNKWLNADGSITDFKGNIIKPADPSRVVVYEHAKAISNKFLDIDDSTKTYAEVTMDIFKVVDVLPETGEKNKIYLVPSKNGMFEEYFWNENGKWDKIGEIDINMDLYPTKTQVADAIAANSTADKKYTDDKIKENITNVLGGEY